VKNKKLSQQNPQNRKNHKMSDKEMEQKETKVPSE